MPLIWRVAARESRHEGTLEGRWALSIRAANLLGVFIAAIAGLWVAYQFVRPYGALIDQLLANEHDPQQERGRYEIGAACNLTVLPRLLAATQCWR